MSFYCLCESRVAGDQDCQVFGAPNRYAALGPTERDLDFPPLMLGRPMVCIKMGARQVLPAGEVPPNMHDGSGRPTYVSEHYPRVDVFECSVCRARIVRE